jgi:hypothetical protein
MSFFGAWRSIQDSTTLTCGLGGEGGELTVARHLVQVKWSKVHEHPLPSHSAACTGPAEEERSRCVGPRELVPNQTTSRREQISRCVPSHLHPWQGTLAEDSRHAALQFVAQIWNSVIGLVSTLCLRLSRFDRFMLWM